ncbi:unnamed protein product [Polarella glacialis]|uniref:Uncharacterized protein n=1 Tax=Polarella glacialis TaxID=89957 RepID=A0A813LBT8_POLGL|nr:unnamed protein product [Polarella glacialis]
MSFCCYLRCLQRESSAPCATSRPLHAEARGWDEQLGVGTGGGSQAWTPSVPGRRRPVYSLAVDGDPEKFSFSEEPDDPRVIVPAHRIGDELPLSATGCARWQRSPARRNGLCRASPGRRANRLVGQTARRPSSCQSRKRRFALPVMMTILSVFGVLAALAELFTDSPSMHGSARF